MEWRTRGVNIKKCIENNMQYLFYRFGGKKQKNKKNKENKLKKNILLQCWSGVDVVNVYPTKCQLVVGVEAGGEGAVARGGPRAGC